MKIDISQLSEYDLNNAKAGDKVIIGYNEYSALWSVLGYNQSRY